MPRRNAQGRSMASSKISSCSDYSDQSDSASTAPTDNSARLSVQHYKVSGNPYAKDSSDIPQYSSHDYGKPDVSAETCASSVSSENPAPNQDLPLHDIPDHGYGPAQVAIAASRPLVSSPQEFADYFPSCRRLYIRHDDSTLDGNMNLRVDTKARASDGRDVDLTLFHLRMHDLKRREFSFRRYGRDSGREICHSTRKCSNPSVKRPGIHRSLSNALCSLRSKFDSKAPTMNLKRQDSGYVSTHEDDVDNEIKVPSHHKSTNKQLSTDTTLLEFSNYAHVEIRHRGAKAFGRYEYEYWGTKYAWKRIGRASGNLQEISYHLYNTKTSASLAHLVPIPQTSYLHEEGVKGGWVPPNAMMLEESVVDGSPDLADVIVASGILALVDDCIDTRWHQKSRSQMSIPMLTKTSLRPDTESVGARQLMDEVLNRRDKTCSRHPVPLRQLSC